MQTAVERECVRLSLERLMTFPFVAERVRVRGQARRDLVEIARVDPDACAIPMDLHARPVEFVLQRDADDWYEDRTRRFGLRRR